jgi:hypothetical protein
VSMAIRSSLVALAVVAILAGCSKKDGGTVETKPAEAPPAASAAPHPVPTVAGDAKVDLTGIAKAEGGKTVAEVHAERSELVGQTVSVRGKVVKTNANIMGKNWLHVQDGSGEDGTKDLTVTTSDGLPDIGETVVVSGTVALDKDYGMGYVYDVILEDATVKAE